MNGDQDIKGLRERLAQAKTPEEINRLLDEGCTYTDASDRTRAAWLHTAARRRAELTAKQDDKRHFEDRGALDQADKESRMVKTALHGIRYGRPINFKEVRSE